jgi:hypothetical protein
MYENISGISIKGKCFDETRKMVFFPAETDRISIVYGKMVVEKVHYQRGFIK